jgi:La-related protein 7
MTVFLTFNKIKSIFASNLIAADKQQYELAKSISSSETLQVTEDNSHVYLKTNVPLKTQKDLDELTIYIEQIPLSSTHDSIKSIFSKYGKINYISLPRYKKSGKLKQFAFLEFDDLASVQNVLQAFKKIDALLLHQNVKPESLLSIKTFEPDQEGGVVVTDKEESKPEAEPESSSSSPPPAKRQKLEDSANESGNDPATATTADKSDVESDADKPNKKKKIRKHKRNQSKKKLMDECVMAMKVMKKNDWKKLRNAYLTLERQKAKEIKKILRESYNKRNESKHQSLMVASKASPKINFYGSPHHLTDQNASESTLDSQQTNIANFTPGCIVNIKFREPCADSKEFKKELKQFPCVQYVDIPEGGSQCFIRVDGSQAAHEIVSHYSSCEYETDILKDDVEREYWKKIADSREKKKRNKDSMEQSQTAEKKKRRRGREKLVIKIAKVTQSNQIIRFSEFDD